MKDIHMRRGAQHLRVHGKGGKLRNLPLHPGTAETIDEYLEAAGHHIAGWRAPSFEGFEAPFMGDVVHVGPCMRGPYPQAASSLTGAYMSLAEAEAARKPVTLANATALDKMHPQGRFFGAGAKAKLKAMYPHAAKGIETTSGMSADQLYERMSRLGIKQNIGFVIFFEFKFNIQTSCQK